MLTTRRRTLYSTKKLELLKYSHKIPQTDSRDKLRPNSPFEREMKQNNNVFVAQHQQQEDSKMVSQVI